MAVTDPDELYEQILDRLMDNVPDDVDKREGSIIYNALSPVALELQEIYEELEDVLQETFADTASLDYLILRARERGVKWIEATNAVVTAELVFSDEIESEPTVTGSVFAVENENLYFDVTGKVSYDSETRTGVYLLTCQEAGTEGNITSGDLILEETENEDIESSIETATITGIATAARDDEDVESLRERYLDSIENEAFGGNVSDYKEKSAGLPVVGSVQILPVWNGAGTVKIRFLNASMDVPTATEIETVQNAFDPSPQASGAGLAPIGHTVTVEGATPVSMVIIATVAFDTGFNWETLYERMVEQCEAYFLNLRKEWESNAVTVSPMVLSYLIKMNVPHIRSISCAINDSTSDFSLTAEKVPVFTSIQEASS